MTVVARIRWKPPPHEFIDYFSYAPTGEEETDESPLGLGAEVRDRTRSFLANFARAAGAGGATADYPSSEGAAMCSVMGWVNAFDFVVERLIAGMGKDEVHFKLNPQACSLVPELVPVRKDAHNTWVDTLGPSYRTISIPGTTWKGHAPRGFLGIIYEEADGHHSPEELARRIRWRFQSGVEHACGGHHEFSVKRYSGSLFVGPDERVNEHRLQQVLRKHRVVLFVGNTVKGRDLDDSGWRLTKNAYVSFKRLKYSLEALGRAGRYALRPPMTELVIACSCQSGAPKSGARTEEDNEAGMVQAEDPFSCPSLFFQAGVRYFVGTAADLILGSDAVFDGVAELLANFIAAWLREHKEPDHTKAPVDAARCLYEAKYPAPDQEEGNLKLANALFQLYCPLIQESRPRGTFAPSDQRPSEESASALTPTGHTQPASTEKESPSVDVDAVPPAPPEASLIEGVGAPKEVATTEKRRQVSADSFSLDAHLEVAVDDRLGDFVLERELWADEVSQGFVARVAGGHETCVLDVPRDRLQLMHNVEGRLDDAVSAWQLGDLSGLLAPSERCLGELSRGGGARGRLHFLTYPAQMSGAATEAFVLAAPALAPLDRTSERHERVLAWVLDLAMVLSRLHADRRAHGALASRHVLVNAGATETGDSKPAVLLKGMWIPYLEFQDWSEVGAEQTLERCREDCRAFGALIYEWCTAQPLPPMPESTGESGTYGAYIDAVTEDLDGVPEVLLRLVLECLMPSDSMVPTMEMMVRRLAWANVAGGTWVSAFDERLHGLFQSGHRLVQIPFFETEEANEFIARFVSRRYPFRLVSGGHKVSCQYVYHRLTTDMGLERVVSGGAPVPVAPCQNMRMLAALGRPPSQEEYEAALSADISMIFGHLASMLCEEENGILQVPLVHIPESDLWQFVPEAGRALQQCQSRGLDGPVIVLTDGFRAPKDFWGLRVARELYPASTPAELFEHILAFGRDEGFSVDEEAAVELAIRLGGRPKNWITQALRWSGMRYGCIDLRVAQAAEEEMRERFRAYPEVRYTSPEDVPEPRCIGVPPAMAARLEHWARSLIEAKKWELGATTPHRFLVAGEREADRSSVATYVAALLKRPLVRLDPGSALQSVLGASEERLDALLLQIMGLGECVVLIEDIGRFSAPPPDQLAAAMDATIQRMSTRLLLWIDHLPPAIVLVMTSDNQAPLSAQWQRRGEWCLELSSPGADGAYRRALFAAVLRRFGLDDLAGDPDLLQAFEGATDINGPRGGRIRHPMTRKFGENAGFGEIRVKTGDEVHHWVEESLLLRGNDEDVESRSYWLSALEHS